MLKNRKILYYLQNDWFLISHRLPVLKEAKKNGYSIHIACKISTHLEYFKNEGYHVHPLRFLGAKRINPLQELFTFLEILFLLIRIRPDILHNISIRPVLWGSLAARISNVRYCVNAITGVGFVFMSTGKKALFIQRIVSSVLEFGMSKKGSHHIFQNNDDISLFKKYRIIDESSPISLLHGSGVDLTKLYSSSEKNKPVEVLFGARLLTDKGIRELVKAAVVLNQRKARFKLIIAGAPDFGNPTAIRPEEVESWNKYPFIDVLGYREDMVQLLSKASIACLPSYREGLPKFLAEAAAAGLPIITTDTPGCREVVIEGENGLLVPVKSFRELAEKLEKLIKSPSLRQKMGSRSRKLAEELFDINKIVENHLSIYQTLVEEQFLE